MKNKRAGITLVALIITVIVLLILAGTAVTISMNGRGLLSKSKEAGSEWDNKVALEENSITETLEVLDIAANPDLAKNRLTVTVNEDETVESPYYVNYPSAKGTIKCRVLYNDSKYGLQIISVNPVDVIQLGINDPNINVEGEMGSLERAQNSYNRAITTLNEKAEEYIATADGSILATDARCVGSDPINKNYPDNTTGEERQSKMYIADSEYAFMEEYNGKFFGVDYLYGTDKRRLAKINAVGFNDESVYSAYIMASRFPHYSTTDERFNFALVAAVADGRLGTQRLFHVKEDGVARLAVLNGFRPVFILSTEVKIIEGEGTEEVPFEIGL